VAPQIVRDICESRGPCSYDPGGEVFRAPKRVIRALGSVDYALLNSKELECLTSDPSPESATSLIGGRLRFVVVKHGEGGAVLVDSSGVVASAKPPKVEIVDATGAGDAFNAAFNVWMLWSGEPLEALRAGVAAGAAKVARRGSSNMPALDEVSYIINRVHVD